VVGDTPYDGAAERAFPFLAEEISRADVAFVIHIGDLKDSRIPCTDSLVASRVAALDAFAHPLVFVPGDNEWTDCHRVPEGTYRPLERLDFLRRQAFPEPGRSRGATPMTVETQARPGAPDFPEHQRWNRQGVFFTTLHVVGSRNGLEGFHGRTTEDDLEVDRRIAAAVEWLRGTFGEARRRNAVAVVVAFQANPWDVPADFAGRTGFEEIMAALREESDAFGRQVLLVHGDTHALRLDRPYWSEDVPDHPNLMRLETFGSPEVGWVQVHVDPTSRGVFGFTPRRTEPVQ
jgi:hypothetical protein